MNSWTVLVILLMGISLNEGDAQEIFEHRLEFYTIDLENDFCPDNSTIFAFNSSKITDLGLELSSSPFVPEDLGSWTDVGLWIIYEGINYENWVLVSLTFEPVCTSVSDLNGTLIVPRSIRFLGNPNPSLVGLSLISGEFDGEEFYFDQDTPSIDPPIEVDFYGYTGTTRWTVYSEENYQGDSICLGADLGWLMDYGNYNLSQVSSARLGCESENVARSLQDTNLDHNYFKNGQFKSMMRTGLSR